jgi:tripartite-type tricarboxylate transporter receptor subunit TctC
MSLEYWVVRSRLRADAKSKPDGMTFASPAVGSQPHLAAELFMRTAGLKGLAVQFQGDATSYTELLAARVDATTTALPTALPHINAGNLRVLGCFSEERSATYPDAPTLREQGQDGSASWRPPQHLIRSSTRCRRRWVTPFRTAT